MSADDPGHHAGLQPQHETPQPQPLLQPLHSGRPPGNGSGGAGAGGAGGGLLGGLDALTGSRGATVAGGAVVLLLAAAWSLGLFSGGPTRTTADQVAAPASSTSTVQLIRPVTGVEAEQAIAMLAMPDADKSRVRSAVASGRVRIGLVTVSDTHDEDGDWVRIAGAGFQQDVRLFHKPHTVAVPYLPGMPVTVIGLVDGGGGDITVAVYVGAAKLSLRPLRKGETVEVPTP